MLLSLWQGHSYDGYWIWCYPPERGDPMMTEQELNNLIVHRETTQPGIPSIVQEMMRLSRALEQQARDLASVHAATSRDGESRAQGQ
jgi:hypothetical protein